MYLAYLDDSGADRANPVFVYGGIVLQDSDFRNLEQDIAFEVMRLLPLDRVETFSEFHASDLFNGTGEFEGINEPERHAALKRLLEIPRRFGSPYFYSAMQKSVIRKGPFGSSLPADTGFRMCAEAIDDWLQKKHDAKLREAGTDLIRQVAAELAMPLCLLVLDDCDDKHHGKHVREVLRQSFMELRRRYRLKWDGAPPEPGRLFNVHDDVYFGNSASSVGLQVADACNFIMLRRFRDGTTDEFYETLARGPVICARPGPQWANGQQGFLTHERAQG